MVTSEEFPTPAPSPSSAPRLILASASPARARILQAAGIPFTVLVSDVDEDAVAARHPDANPEQTALLLAQAKARDVAERSEAADALVVGCDSVFELDGVPYGKPWEPEVAVERWLMQSGRSGVLHTGHWVVDTRGGSQAGGTSSAMVTFAPVDEDQIRAYVATQEPLQCAGAFTIDGRGAAFIESVQGDPNAVIGLSVSALRSALGQLGVDLTAYWGFGGNLQP
ncbi:Maf family protein [Micrococcus terreus]|uniref:Maf family protein n=1 Tax=Micrococcus terreus TaxID=574650 RepID=UPI0023F64FD4|nr:nucleoside triphosphate pyrophosphatase [Micrococcus terreus]